MSSGDEDNDFEDDSLCKYGSQLPQYEAGKFAQLIVENMKIKLTFLIYR